MIIHRITSIKEIKEKDKRLDEVEKELKEKDLENKRAIAEVYDMVLENGGDAK